MGFVISPFACVLVSSPGKGRKDLGQIPQLLGPSFLMLKHMIPADVTILRTSRIQPGSPSRQAETISAPRKLSSPNGRSEHKHSRDKSLFKNSTYRGGWVEDRSFLIDTGYQFTTVDVVNESYRNICEMPWVWYAQYMQIYFTSRVRKYIWQSPVWKTRPQTGLLRLA